MNKIKTLIVDDEPISQKHLTSILQQYCPDLQVVNVASDADEALEKILMEKPALVFLDIELGGESGFDVLKKCANKNFEVIFVTAHNQFGIDAVKAHAFDYILKPINKVELLLSVENVVQLIRSKTNTQAISKEKTSSRMSIPTMEGITFIELNDIMFIEAEGRYSKFYLTNNSKVVASKNMGEFEVELEHKGFARIHHSYMVNLHFVEKYIKGRGGYVVLKNGKTLEVSIRKKDDFFDKLEEA